MKRYIKSAVDPDYPISILIRDDQHTSRDIENELRDILKPAAPYIKDVRLDLTIWGDLRVSSNQRINQIYITSKSKNLDRCLDTLFNKLQDEIPRWVQQIEALQDRKSKGLSTVTAMTLVSRLITQKFGLSPTFRYNDTGKLLYMLYRLPFADIATNTLDHDAGEKLAQEFDAYLSEIESTYNLSLWWDLPLGGSVVRAAWIISVSKSNPKFVYDKSTNEYVPVT